MLTILLGCTAGLALAGGLHLAWPGHLWAQIVVWLVGFFGVSVGANLAIHRKLKAIFGDVQGHIESTQMEWDSVKDWKVTKVKSGFHRRYMKRRR